jgi:hypothetical protein
VVFNINNSVAKASNDVGVMLLYNLTHAKESYVYGVDIENNGKSLQSCNGTISNSSITPRYQFNWSKPDLLPKDIQGEVIIHPNLSAYNLDKNGNIFVEERKVTVFHELQENFERTTNKKPFLYTSKIIGSSGLPEIIEDTSNPGAHALAGKSAQGTRFSPIYSSPGNMQNHIIDVHNRSK